MPVSLTSLPRPVLFGSRGLASAVVVLTLSELILAALRPQPRVGLSPREIPTPAPTPQTPRSTQSAELAGAPLLVKPNITAPKPAEGCRQSVPDAAGERYCMLCKKTF